MINCAICNQKSRLISSIHNQELIETKTKSTSSGGGSGLVLTSSGPGIALGGGVVSKDETTTHSSPLSRMCKPPKMEDSFSVRNEVELGNFFGWLLALVMPLFVLGFITTLFPGDEIEHSSNSVLSSLSNMQSTIGQVYPFIVLAAIVTFGYIHFFRSRPDEKEQNKRIERIQGLNKLIKQRNSERRKLYERARYCEDCNQFFDPETNISKFADQQGMSSLFTEVVKAKISTEGQS